MIACAYSHMNRMWIFCYTLPHPLGKFVLATKSSYITGRMSLREFICAQYDTTVIQADVHFRLCIDSVSHTCIQVHNWNIDDFIAYMLLHISNTNCTQCS